MLHFNGQGLEDKSRCVVHFLGLTWMDSSSFALYTFSMSTFLQALLVISMNGAADYGMTFYDDYLCRSLPQVVFVVLLRHRIVVNSWLWNRRNSRTISLPPRKSLRYRCQRILSL